ncbi:MAG: hypothetical protein AAF682_10230 [Planctomycetota bacterium]
MRHLLLGLALLCAPAIPTAQTQWTVKPDGSGDFLDVGSAVAAVSAGDVLLISAGDYGQVLVDKPLVLLGEHGQPRPHFDTLTVASVPWFVASHLAPEWLTVDDVPGPSHFDDLEGYVADFSGDFDAHLSRSRFHAPPEYGHAATFDGDSGLADPARARVVDCDLRGCDRAGFWDYSFYVAGTGGDAVHARRAEVQVVGSDLRGGDGENGSGGLGFGGRGVYSTLGSEVEVRGSASNTISGGTYWPGPAGSAVTGAALSGSGITVSGVTLVGALLGTVAGVSDRPYLELGGSGAPGATRSIDFYGPDPYCGATTVFLAFGASHDPSYLATHTAALELDLATIFATLPIDPKHQDEAVSIAAATPADTSLAGLTVYAQALQADYCAGSSPAWWLTNAAAIHLGY